MPDNRDEINCAKSCCKMFGVIQVLANKVRHRRIIQFGLVNRQLVFAVSRLRACPETSRSWGFLGTLNELMLRSEEATRLLFNAQRPTLNTSNRTASIETLGVERWALMASDGYQKSA